MKANWQIKLIIFLGVWAVLTVILLFTARSKMEVLPMVTVLPFGPMAGAILGNFQGGSYEFSQHILCYSAPVIGLGISAPWIPFAWRTKDDRSAFVLFAWYAAVLVWFAGAIISCLNLA